jgi:hypothetical protein
MAKPAASARKPKTMAARKTKFLTLLADTCNVSKAARGAGVATSTLYEHRRRFPVFAAQWDAATAEALDELEETLIARAKSGVERPVYFRGEQVGSVRSYSDALAMFLLKAKRPEIYARSIDAAPLAIEEMTQEEARAEVTRRIERIAAAEAAMNEDTQTEDDA